MIPTGLVSKVNARLEAQELAAARQTDNEEGQLQNSQATTAPLQDSPDSPSGQLQQPTSTDSPRVRSLEGSMSSSASNRPAGIQAGIRSVAISSDYAVIFYELSRIQAAFPQFDIDIINAEDQQERVDFLQYVATTLEIQPQSKIFSSSDFLGALVSEEKRLHRNQQIEQKKKEQSILTDRLNQLQSEYDDKLEREVEQAERDFHQRGKAE